MKPLRGLLPVGAPCWLESIAGTRARRHKEWRRRPDDPPDGALYGRKNSPKRNWPPLTVVVDTMCT